MSEQDLTDAYQAKMDELNDGLLEAYAAGFAKAKETYGVERGPNDVQALMQTEGVSSSHFYYWDGRSKPLEFWLRDQFGLDESEIEQ